MNAFWIALQFLTRLPTPRFEYQAEPAKSSLYFYGLVGLIIGSLLWTANTALQGFSATNNTSVIAAIVLLLWVLVTGALHIDGLADSADAWLGGNNKQRTLDIMKDPRSGPAGVTAVVIILLLKYASLAALLQNHHAALIIAPALARGLIPFLFITTPYARQEGLGQAFADNLSLKTMLIPMLGACILGILLMGIPFIVILMLTILTLTGLRALMLQRIEGTTGDTAGACIEIMETVILVSLTFMV